MRNAFDVFVEAFRDVWTLLGMIATVTGFVLVFYKFREFPIAGTVLKALGFYEVAARLVFYPIEQWLGHALSQTLKDIVLLYILFGVTLTRSYYVFCRKGDRDVASGKAEYFMYGHKGRVLGRILQPRDNQGTVWRFVALLICFLLWLPALATNIGYVAFNPVNDDDVSIVGEVGLRSIFMFQVSAILLAAFVFIATQT